MTAGPPSDAQLAELLEQQKSRRRKAIFIFGAVSAVLVIALVGASTYFSAQAKRKRNAAYSRVVKCMFGTPLAEGEPPMQRFRAAWRGRIVATDIEAEKEPIRKRGKPAELAKLDLSEEQKAKLWPNRCVAEIQAFTDVLKELGEMKETEKDLGYYSRNLTKETAGDNWQQLETYKTALDEFWQEAAKGKFEFIDPADVKGPTLVEAKGVEDLMAGGPFDADYMGTPAQPGAIRFYLPAGKGKPERLCTSLDGKELRCIKPIPTGLPPEASGIPWILPSDDEAKPLLAFGRRSGIANGESVSTGVYRAGDGLQLVPPDTFYVAGGWSKADGSAAVLIKDKDDPFGEKFKVATVAAGATKVEITELKLDGWDGSPAAIAIVGGTIMYATNADEIAHVTIGSKEKESPFKLPGRGRSVRGCRVGTETLVMVQTNADSLRRLIVGYPDKPFGATGVAVVDDGDVACGKNALTVLSDNALSTCAGGTCKTAQLGDEAFGGRRAVVDGSIITAETENGLLQVRVTKDGKETTKVVYDAHLKGRDVVSKSRMGSVTMSTGRDFALLSFSIDEKLYLGRIDGAGAVSPVKVVSE